MSFSIGPGHRVVIGDVVSLTKRELLAALAMNGLLADSNGTGSASDYAADAVRCADALIAALKKESSDV